MNNPDDEFSWRSGCPVASALDVVGDKWSLLIIRDMFVYGSRTFSQLLNSQEGISTNILSSRLNHLSSFKLVERVNPDAGPRNNSYRLTKQGLELRPTIDALARWAVSNVSDIHVDLHPFPQRGLREKRKMVDAVDAGQGSGKV